MNDNVPELRERSRRAMPSLRMSGNGRIRVLLADDHVLLRQAMRMMLDAQEGLEVVGEVDNGREAVDAAEELKVDIVLMDMRMPTLNGIDATRQIRKRCPSTRVLIVTGVGEDEYVLEALRAGASGYVVKQSDVSELLVAIQAVHRGNPYFSASLSDGRTAMELIMAAQKSTDSKPEDVLTAREREVLQLVVEGNSNQAIAEQLFLSVKTVEAHKAHIMSKLRLQNQTDLIRYALRRGIISLESGDEGPPARRDAG